MADILRNTAELPLMMDKRPSSTALRRACFDANKKADSAGRFYLVCHICSGPIWPQKGDAWEADHVLRRVLSEDDSTENLKPAHVKCHREKTKDDIRENAKGKRVRDKYMGFRRPTRSMPGSRNSPWKIKLNGTVERR